MKITSIKDFDINNGEGIRVSIWVSGCHFKCDGCHNKVYWDNSKGTEFSEEHVDKVVSLLEEDISKDLSILGGEPLETYNSDAVTKLCKIVKDKYPEKTIWLWTGNRYEDIRDLEIIKYLDIIVDGQFVKSMYSEKLLWKGSSNQRIINVQESLKQGQVVLYLE